MFNPFSFVLFRSPSQSLNKVFKVERDSNIFQEGIYISSRDFWLEFQKDGNLFENDKIYFTLLKYWIRNCTRCTPYATFAGCALANIDDHTKLLLNSTNAHYRHVRIDTNYLSLIIKHLIQIPELKSQLKFYTNNSIYEIADNYRYAEYTLQNNIRNYQLSSIDKTKYVSALLRRAERGATFDEMANLLIQMEGVNNYEAIAFLNEMLNAQLLVSQLEPSVTGKEPLDQLVDNLGSFNGIENVLSLLREVQRLIRNPQAGTVYYQKIENELNKLTEEVPKDILQTDLFLSATDFCVEGELVKNIIHQAVDLTVFARKNTNLELELFIKKFIQQYEDAEIPLTIALDTEMGLGYAGIYNDAAGSSSLVDDLSIENVNESTNNGFDYIQQYAFSKYIEFKTNNLSQIEILESDLNHFKKQTEAHQFSNSMYLMGSLFKRDEILDSHNFTFHLKAFSGPSAGNLLGRFAHGDESLANFTKELLIAEEGENPDAIYAEIVHLPEARIGNILLRPVFRRYEIPYVGISGAPEEHQIPVGDIMVSIRNNEIILRSKKYNKRIIPRLTTAHNYSNKSLPTYKFLCDLQKQSTYQACLWDWGNIVSLRQLPRVVYKNLIIARARWKIDEIDINDLPKDTANYIAYFKQFRDKYELPQRVIYKENDNELLIDFNEQECIELFLSYLKKYKIILIEEFLFTEDNCVINDINNAPFTNEMIIPIKKEVVKNVFEKKNIEPQKYIKRKYIPYSEWLYYKIYCGPRQAEQILKEILLPFIEKGLQVQLFEKVFFIRYKDDFPHLRVRFYNSNADVQPHLNKLLMQILKPLVDNNSINKIQLDTYSREIERYRANLIEDTETLFFHDSLAVLRIINIIGNIDTEKYRLLFALRGIEMFLDDFELSLPQKKALLKIMQGNYFKEFGASAVLQKQLNQKYRQYQKDIFSFLDIKNDSANKIEHIIIPFITRSFQNKETINSMLNKIGKTDREQHLFNLLPSYIHMFMNRLYISQQRKYELVIYHFLEKFYSSSIAMKKEMKQ